MGFFLTLSQHKCNNKHLFPLPVDSLFMQEENRSNANAGIFMFNIKEKSGSGQHTGKIAENLFITERLSL